MEDLTHLPCERSLSKSCKSSKLSTRNQSPRRFRHGHRGHKLQFYTCRDKLELSHLLLKAIRRNKSKSPITRATETGDSLKTVDTTGQTISERCYTSFGQSTHISRRPGVAFVELVQAVWTLRGWCGHTPQQNCRMTRGWTQVADGLRIPTDSYLELFASFPDGLWNEWNSWGCIYMIISFFYEHPVSATLIIMTGFTRSRWCLKREYWPPTFRWTTTLSTLMELMIYLKRTIRRLISIGSQRTSKPSTGPSCCDDTPHNAAWYITKYKPKRTLIAGLRFSIRQDWSLLS